MGTWPGGARGALCLSFDNLGEAAAIELGAIAADDPGIGEHPTVTQALPALLKLLDERELAATFFVEGLNAELYPEALRSIAAGGHEVAYHAWRHEQWGNLSGAEQAENLRRGQAAFAQLELEIAGLRPPGGQLGAGGIQVLREAGLRYASPAGEGAGMSNGVALVPFRWDHVDASCVLPPLASVRERIAGSAEPLGPADFLRYLATEVERIAEEGGIATLVLHLPMLDWWGEETVRTLLDGLARQAAEGRVWLATCAAVAEHVHSRPADFESAALDPTSWDG